MSTPIQVTSTSPTQNFVGATSRYAKSKVIYYGSNNLITFSTYIRNTYPLSSDDVYMVISKTREFRPDLVAYEHYGIVTYWWKIMEANGIFDIMDFQAGLNIRLPAAIT